MRRYRFLAFILLTNCLQSAASIASSHLGTHCASHLPVKSIASFVRVEVVIRYMSGMLVTGKFIVHTVTGSPKHRLLKKNKMKDTGNDRHKKPSFWSLEQREELSLISMSSLNHTSRVY